ILLVRLLGDNSCGIATGLGTKCLKAITFRLKPVVLYAAAVGVAAALILTTMQARKPSFSAPAVMAAVAPQAAPQRIAEVSRPLILVDGVVTGQGGGGAGVDRQMFSAVMGEKRRFK